jgi:Tfp pilus assembly protein PilV
MSLVELVVAMAVLAVGMTAVSALFSTSVLTNQRGKVETSATMLAQSVLETIAAQPANQSAALPVLDCVGTVWPVQTAGAGTPGHGANLDATGAAIDFNQPYAEVTSGYKMQYAACGNASQQIIMDVRWNVQTITAATRLITVGARPLASAAVNRPAQFAPPVSLRTIGGL